MKSRQKTETILEEIILQPFFEKKVETIRKQFNVKPGIITPRYKSGKLYMPLNDMPRGFKHALGELILECKKFISKRYGLEVDPFPLSMGYLLAAYIARDEKMVEASLRHPSFVYFLPQDEYLPLEMHSDRVFPELVILPHASKQDVINFIDKEWHMIKMFLDRPKSYIGIRRRKDIDRDRRVREMYKMGKKKLLFLYGTSGELVTSYILV